MNKIDFKNDFKLTLIEEEQHYKDLFKMFEKIKNERKEKYLKLKKKEHELCDLLNENSYSVSDGNLSFFFLVFYLVLINFLKDSAIAESVLENIENHIVCLTKEKV